MDTLKDRLLALDDAIANHNLICCFKLSQPHTSKDLYHYLMHHLFDLVHLSTVRVLFKFGLNSQDRPFGLDKENRCVPIDSADVHHSLAAKEKILLNQVLFPSIAFLSEQPLFAWLDLSYKSQLFNFEVGIQILQSNNSRLVKSIVQHCGLHKLPNLFFEALVKQPKGLKLLAYNNDLLALSQNTFLNELTLFHNTQQPILNLILDNQYGQKIIYAHDGRLLTSFSPEMLIHLIEINRYGMQTMFFKILINIDTEALLYHQNFYWVRKLGEDQFDNIFYQLLDQHDFDLLTFAQKKPMLLILFSLFISGREWLGLPLAVSGDPLEENLNFQINDGLFKSQSIGYWLTKTMTGLTLLKEKYINQLILDGQIKFNLSRSGDLGKQLMVTAASYNHQTDFSTRLSRFSFFKRKHDDNTLQKISENGVTVDV